MSRFWTLAATAALMLSPAFAQQRSLTASVGLTSLHNGHVSFLMRGRPHETAFLLAGSAAPLAIPTPFGLLYLDPGSAFVVGGVVLDQSGAGTFPIQEGKSQQYRGGSKKRTDRRSGDTQSAGEPVSACIRCSPGA